MTRSSWSSAAATRDGGGAVHLALRDKVYLVHRREEFRASPIMADRARANEKIEFVLNKVVVEVLGEPSVVAVRLEDTITGEQSMLETDGLFVAIGHDPNTALFLDQLDHEPGTGYLVTRGKSTATNVEGVFAAGGVRDHVYRQAVTAAGSGCAAALDAERWLSEQRTQLRRPSPARGKADAGVTLARVHAPARPDRSFGARAPLARAGPPRS